MDYNPDPPFTKPHDVGNGGIPLKFMEHHGDPNVMHGSVTQATPGQVRGGLSAPSAQGPVRPRERAGVPSNRK